MKKSAKLLTSRVIALALSLTFALSIILTGYTPTQVHAEDSTATTTFDFKTILMYGDIAVHLDIKTDAAVDDNWIIADKVGTGPTISFNNKKYYMPHPSKSLYMSGTSSGSTDNYKNWYTVSSEDEWNRWLTCYTGDPTAYNEVASLGNKRAYSMYTGHYYEYIYYQGKVYAFNIDSVTGMTAEDVITIMKGVNITDVTEVGDNYAVMFPLVKITGDSPEEIQLDPIVQTGEYDAELHLPKYGTQDLNWFTDYKRTSASTLSKLRGANYLYGYLETDTKIETKDITYIKTVKLSKSKSETTTSTELGYVGAEYNFPTYNGEDFTWYSDSARTQEFDTTSTITEDKTLYGYYDASTGVEEYTITFVLLNDIGVTTTTSQKTEVYDEGATIVFPTSDGKTYTWYENEARTVPVSGIQTALSDKTYWGYIKDGDTSGSDTSGSGSSTDTETPVDTTPDEDPDAEFKIVLANDNIYYTGVAQTPAITVTHDGETVDSSEYTVSYSDNKNAGRGTITISDVAGGDYTVTGTRKFTIKPAILTVTANAATKTYGTADPTLTYEYSGLVNSESISDNLSGVLSRAEGTDVGTYVITQGSLKTSSNYSLNFKSANLTITKAPHQDVTTTATIPIGTTAVTNAQFDLTAYLESGANLESSSASGDLASYIVLNSLSNNKLIYTTKALTDTTKTGSIVLTVSSTNYDNYKITIPVAAGTKSSNTTFDKGSTSLKSAETRGLDTYAEELTDASVAVTAAVTGKKDSDISSSIRNKVEDKIYDYFDGVDESHINIEYFNIDVKKTVNNDTANPITVTDLGSPIEIKIGLSTSDKYDLLVLREHDGSVKKFSKLDSKPSSSKYKDATYYVTDEYVYIYSQYFSTFAIASTDKEVHTVTFKNGDDETEKKVLDGEKVKKPSDPEKDGKTFKGWYNGDEAYNFDDAVKKDLTLTAKWDSSGAKSASSGSKGAPKTGDISVPIVLSSIITLLGFISLAVILLLYAKKDSRVLLRS